MVLEKNTCRMSSFQYRRRYAISSVISSVILSAAVLVVGGMIWNYASGASSVMATQYFNESQELVKQLQERYMVEHISNNSTHITVWIYNYGGVDIELVVYANNNGTVYSTDQNNPIPISSKSNAQGTIVASSSEGDIIGINVYSRRQNNVYYMYIAQ